MTPTVVGDLDLDLAGCCLELEGFYLTGDLMLGKGFDGVSLAFVTMDPAAGSTVELAHDAWGIDLLGAALDSRRDPGRAVGACR